MRSSSIGGGAYGASYRSYGGYYVNRLNPAKDRLAHCIQAAM